jgi:hypothetical protein
MDIKNAHSTFDRAKANLTVQRAAQTNPNLKLLAIGLDAVTIVKPDILMRSNKRAKDSQRIFSSESEGGQENVLTGVTFALLIDEPFKKSSARHSGMS